LEPVVIQTCFLALRGDYVGIRLRENGFDPSGQRQPTFLDKTSCPLLSIRALKKLSHFQLTTHRVHSCGLAQSFCRILICELSFQDHWIQPLKPSLHPFAMLTAPRAAEYTWRHSEYISPQLPGGQGRGTWGSCTRPSSATKLWPAELQQLHMEVKE
uniref:Uncharacterized protein n=1 Tax=Anas platyrhynchos platyrhynchos TaxID=8840 RepID=A0A493TXB7_ANAPP